MDDTPWWKTPFQTRVGESFLVVLIILSIPLWPLAWVSLIGFWKIKYWGAPPGCCQCACQRCPWGNRKYARYKKEMLEFIASRGKPGIRPWVKRDPGHGPCCKEDL